MSASSKAMKEHGDTTVTVEGRVVRNRPRYSSNNEGIDRNWELVLKAASVLDHWVLWADADYSFAMTPDSLDLIITRMKTLKEKGCVGLAVTISSPMMPYYAKKIESEISIPFLASASVDEIKEFIENIPEES